MRYHLFFSKNENKFINSLFEITKIERKHIKQIVY